MKWGLSTQNEDGSLDKVIQGLESGVKVDKYFESLKVQEILKKKNLNWGDDYYTVSGILYVKATRKQEFIDLLSKLKVFNSWFEIGKAEGTSAAPGFYAIEIISKK